MSKPVIATASLAGCFGCHMSLLDIDEKILQLVEVGVQPGAKPAGRALKPGQLAVGPVEEPGHQDQQGRHRGEIRAANQHRASRSRGRGAADRFHADAVLVSQVVTQRNIHVQQLTRVVELFQAEGLRERVLMIVGGPGIDPRLAKELGYDAGFGRGTRPSQVAAFIAQRLIERKANQELGARG